MHVLLRAGALPLFAIVLLAPLATAHPPEAPLETLVDAPQPAAFCIVVIQPLDGFRAVRITVDEELTEARKEADFDDADRDHDGIVTSEEAEVFQLSTTAFYKGGLGMGNESLWVQGSFASGDAGEARPVYGVTWRHLGHGFYGEAVSNHTGQDKSASATFDQFETQQVREYAFNIPDGASSFTLNGADEDSLGRLDSNWTYSPHAVIEYVVVLAPEGWNIASVQGYNYTGRFFQKGPATRLDIAGFDTSAPWSIGFVKADPASQTPPPPRTSPSLWPLALLVPIAAALVRRRGGAIP